MFIVSLLAKVLISLANTQTPANFLLYLIKLPRTLKANYLLTIFKDQQCLLSLSFN